MDTSKRKYTLQEVLYFLSLLAADLPKDARLEVPKVVTALKKRSVEGLPERHVAAICPAIAQCGAHIEVGGGGWLRGNS